MKLRLSRKNRAALESRVYHVARAALKARGFVTPIDILVGLGWLDDAALVRWRAGELPELEAACQKDSRWVALAMQTFRYWRGSKKLVPRREVYLGGPDGQTRLQFSRSGVPHIERGCRTHWLLPELALEQGEAPQDPDDDEWVWDEANRWEVDDDLWVPDDDEATGRPSWLEAADDGDIPF